MFNLRPLWIGSVLLLAATLAQADGNHQHHAAPASSAVTVESRLTIALEEIALRDQHGRTVALLEEVIGSRLVVMDFIYTSCNTVCPILSAVMGQLQQRLGDRLGREVRLISISVDPVTDTPARLAAHAARLNAGDDWFFLTGDKAEIDQLLVKLGAYTPDLNDHPAMVLVGDPASGNWTRNFGFTSPATLITELDQLAAGRAQASSTTH